MGHRRQGRGRAAAGGRADGAGVAAPLRRKPVALQASENGRVRRPRIPQCVRQARAVRHAGASVLTGPRRRTGRIMAESHSDEAIGDERLQRWPARFYLKHEKKILGTITVVVFITIWELAGSV